MEASPPGLDGGRLTLRLAVLSTGRQDWGILRSTCLRLREDPAFDFRLLVGGMHCSRRYGLTAEQIRGEGFAPAESLAWIADEPAPVFEEAAGALAQVGAALGRQRPEALLLVGDRLETAAAALAATLGAVPLVHIHGGEESEGAFDNNLRHAITKLSHLHLVSHEEHRARVVAMGEDPGSVHVVGAPGLDNLNRSDLPSRDELQSFLGLELTPPVVVVTLHPATLGDDPAREAAAVCAAMDVVPATYVITMPNTDPGSEAIRDAFLRASSRPQRTAVQALGDRYYWALLRSADAMLGNSSSGLIEAPALGLPAVDVGQRQRGRLRGRNVIGAPAEGAAVAAGLRQALEPGLRERLSGQPNPYGDGHSAERIHRILKAWRAPHPPVKRAIMAGVVQA